MEQGNNLTRDEARDRAKLVSGVVQEVRFDFTGSGEDYRMETVIGFDFVLPPLPFAAVRLTVYGPAAA